MGHQDRSQADDPSSRSRTAERAASRRSTLVRCVVLFTVGLVVRLAYLGYFGIESQKGGDMEGYMALARHLANGQGFTFDGVAPTTYRPPLFSWLLGAWCYVLGSTSLETMVAFEVGVQTLCAPMTYLLVRQVQRSERYARAAGLFVAAYILSLFSAAYLLVHAPVTMAGGRYSVPVIPLLIAITGS